MGNTALNNFLMDGKYCIKQLSQMGENNGIYTCLEAIWPITTIS